MPGILYHVYFAKQVYKKLSTRMPINKINFLAGNLIPDESTDKRRAHYKKEASEKGIYVPDLKQAKSALFSKENSVKLGMYCHLYLDYHFIEGFLIPSFIWDFENDKITCKRSNKKWSVKSFFSKDGLYRGYGEINGLLIKDGHVPMKLIDEVPEQLPNTGIEVFDTRIDKTWKEELDEYLSRMLTYTGEIFDYEELTMYIRKLAEQLVEEILQ